MKKNEVACCESSQELHNTASENRSLVVCKPLMKFGETATSYVVHVELPGVCQEQVELTLQKNVLSLKAVQKLKVDETYSHLLGNGAELVYQRNLVLREEIDRNGIKAVIKDGLLRIDIPKKPENLAVRIAVQSS